MPVDPAAVSLDPSSPNPDSYSTLLAPVHVRSLARTWASSRRRASRLAKARVSSASSASSALNSSGASGFADAAYRAHEQEPEASLDAAAGLGLEVSERDRRIGVRKRLGHQLVAIEIEASHVLDAVVDRLERLEDRALYVAQLWISPPGTTAYSPKNRHQPSDDAGA